LPLFVYICCVFVSQNLNFVAQQQIGEMMTVHDSS